MRILRRLIFLVAIVWLVVELAAIFLAGRVLEQAVATRTRGVASVDASVGSFPVITRFALTGRVNTVRVTLRRIARLGVSFAEVRFDLDGVAVDRAALLRGDVGITAIDRGSVTATIDLSRVAGGVPAGSDVRMAGRTLVIGAVSLRLSSELLPCDPQVRRLGSQVIASCTVADVPPILLDAAQRR